MPTDQSVLPSAAYNPGLAIYLCGDAAASARAKLNARREKLPLLVTISLSRGPRPILWAGRLLLAHPDK
jgi:hypothetical protein